MTYKQTLDTMLSSHDWVFPEEFLPELAAAQMRYTQKLARR